MKLTIPLRDGLNLIFEGSYEELVPVAERYVHEHGGHIGSIGDQVDVHVKLPLSTNGGRRWTEQSVRKLWALLYGEQAKVVKFLLERGGKAKYTELTKHLGYGAQNLSGILSPITRNAQTATGDRLARLVDWRIPEDGKREYYIDVEALPFLSQIASRQ